MKFGIREICDVVFKAKSKMKIGSATFQKGQPVLYIDTATASTLEQATTTVYAQGGRGNTRLITWEGEKTLTFTITDALLSPIGFSILAGAGLFKGSDESTMVNVHATSKVVCSVGSGSNTVKVDLSDVLGSGETISPNAPIFAALMEDDSIVEVASATASVSEKVITFTFKDDEDAGITATTQATKFKDKVLFVDYYLTKKAAKVHELQIDASTFGGNFYVEASTLFRRQSDGMDMPAEITMPNVKIQSNFTFSMASTGDPSTFDFTMDALPGYTVFDNTKKVLCVLQIVEDAIGTESDVSSVMLANDSATASSVAEG